MRNTRWPMILILTSLAMAACDNKQVQPIEAEDECPNDPAKTTRGICGCGIPDIFDVAAGDYTCHLTHEIDYCPYDPLKTDPGICGCGIPDDDLNRNGLPDCIENNLDLCPDDPLKKLPGICGCGIPDDVDKNGNGLPDCIDEKYSENIDLCPDDPDKTAPGTCGCGMKEVTDSKGNAVCSSENVDLCPNDPNKTAPGVCGCGIPDEDLDNNNIPDCLDEEVDLCPDDKNKKLPGICGCGVSDLDIEPETGIPRCISDQLDLCPEDNKKTRPGICGCGISDDLDTDNDGTPDCIDQCPEDKTKTSEGICGCGVPDSTKNVADSDGDSIPNCLDFCPDNKWKSKDDTCSCDSILYTLNEKNVCARILSTAQDLIDFRDHWNDGTLSTSLEPLTFMVVNDINLGDILTQTNAGQWTGIGTESHPFDAVFVGSIPGSENKKPVIKATRTKGKVTETLIFGNNEASHISLFGYTSGARIDNIHVQMSFTGKDYVAGLVAHASETNITRTMVTEATIEGENMVAGLAAEFTNGAIQDINISSNSVPDSISASQNDAAGLVATASNSQITNVSVQANIIGNDNVGGIAAQLHTVTLSNASSSGTITGKANTSALVGVLSEHSTLLNAYTMAKLICQGSPCASLTAVINEFSTIKNAYTTGPIIDEIPEIDPDDPPTPPTDPDTPPNEKDPDQPGNEEDDDVKPEQTLPIEVPAALLIASFHSLDNITENLYYWGTLTEPALPPAITEQKYIAEPQEFEYVSLVPIVTESARPLINELGSNMTCYDNRCSIDNISCLQWTAAQKLILIPNATQMTVTLPVLDTPH